MSDGSIRTRFAPSPTGVLHVGNARTALFNFLYARGSGGRFLLRIEDTDAERSQEPALDALCDDLRWLGLEWDEGPGRGGDVGPYRQSERTDVYVRHYRALEQAGRAYPCFCTPTELKLARKRQQAAGQPPRYPGTCRELGQAERDRRFAQGERAALRFALAGAGEIGSDDLIRGEQRFDAAAIGDFVIRRSDGTPGFLFSNAVDDALMGITHVLRGEDHLSNTPRQLVLIEALGLAPPRYGHLPLVVGADGVPLSKRHGSASLAGLRAEGYLPEAVVNQLARLGHHGESDQLLDLAQLARAFSLARVGKAPARHDVAQLGHWQREALAARSTERLWQWLAGAGGELERLVPEAEREAFTELVRDNVERPGDGCAWARRLLGESGEWAAAARAALRDAGPDVFASAQPILATEREFRDFTRELARVTGLKGKALYMPLRAALTGELQGPELARVFDFLGPERVRARLAAAESLAGEAGD